MPLTEKGETILAAMRKKYGEKRGEQVFYASKNAGTISGVDSDVLSETAVAKLLDEWQRKKRKKRGTYRDPFGREIGTYSEREDAMFEVLGDAQPQIIQMYDTLELDDAAKVSMIEGGYLRAQPRIARTGIQLYKGSECGRPEMETVRVYRPADSVFHPKATHSYTHLPITMDHPKVPVTADNWKKYAIGETGEEVLRDGGTVRVPMMLRDAAAIKSIKDGKNQLSVGYACELDWQDGVTEDGEPYDAIQTGIRANHLAVVAAARGGEVLKIGDDDQTQETTMNLKNVTVDGIECQMTDTAAALVQKTIKTLSDSLQQAKDAFGEEKKKTEEKEKECKDALDTIKVKDAEIVTLKKQIEDAKITPAQLDAMVKDRQTVVDKAKAIIGNALVVDGKTITEIKKQVVDAKIGKSAEGWGDAEIGAAFSTLTATAGAPPAGGGSSFRDGVNAFASRPHFANDARAQAYADADKEAAEAWKKGK